MSFRFLAILSMALWLPLQVAAAEGPMGTIRGHIEAPGVENYRGVVSVWDSRSGRVPDPRKYIIIPSMFAMISPSGEFLIEVPPGNYYVGAIVRQSEGQTIGPPREGDLVFMTPDKNGNGLLVEVKEGENVDLGVRNLGWRYQGMVETDNLAIGGRVTDAQGLPVAGLLVFGFADPGMSQKPLAVSQRTDPDGRYELRLDHAGQVYLRVRDSYGGGSPVEGGYMGVYGGKIPVPVAVSEDRFVDGADITVFKIPPNKSVEMKARNGKGAE